MRRRQQRRGDRAAGRAAGQLACAPLYHRAVHAIRVDALEFLFAVKGTPPLWCCGVRPANEGEMRKGVVRGLLPVDLHYGLEFSICQLVSG
jgi:hypothetical protein